MTGEDIEQLMVLSPQFKDMTLENTDVEIQNSIFCMSRAMAEVQPPDLANAEPLTGA